MPRFRKLPVFVDAVQYDGTNMTEVVEFAGPEKVASVYLVPGRPIVLATLEGEMRADVGDWIVRGVKGEHYPCKPDVFELTYERARRVGHAEPVAAEPPPAAAPVESRRSAFCLLAVVLLIAVVLAALSFLSTSGSSARSCTHGASSVGPVTIVGGKLSGSTTPHATGCTP